MIIIVGFDGHTLYKWMKMFFDRYRIFGKFFNLTIKNPPTSHIHVKMAMGRRIELNLISYKVNLGKKTFTSLSNLFGEFAVGEADPTRRGLDPNLVTSSREERRLMKLGISPIGSRRRRAAIKTSENIPFEKLPYLCFQEARKVLLDEREDVLKKIKTERSRISNLLRLDASKLVGGQQQKDSTLRAMNNYLTKLKIEADINDPMIKKRFEDGLGKQV